MREKQHALLKLASLHRAAGEGGAADAALGEAVRVAREEGDRECLELCR
jgi:hypothetical protein